MLAGRNSIDEKCINTMHCPGEAISGELVIHTLLFCDRFFEAFKNPPQIPNTINMTLHDTKSRLQDLSLNTFRVPQFQMTLDVQLLHEVCSPISRVSETVLLMISNPSGSTQDTTDSMIIRHHQGLLEVRRIY